MDSKAAAGLDAGDVGTRARKVCVVTGSRADYGLVKPLMEELKVAEDFQLQILVYGSHLAPHFGRTVDIIEEDFNIDEKVEMLLASESAVGVSSSIGLGCIGCASRCRSAPGHLCTIACLPPHRTSQEHPKMHPH